MNIFESKEYKKIFDRLQSNNNLVKFLEKFLDLKTASDFYIDDNQPDKSEEKLKQYLQEKNKAVFDKLTKVLLKNKEIIENNSVNTLLENENLINELYEKTIGTGMYSDEFEGFFRELFYLYKNSYVDNFFQNNWRQFLPTVEEEALDDNDFALAIVEAITKEFDKISNIITDTKDFKSYEDIPEDYIHYLSQLLGIDKQTFFISDDEMPKFRILAANIIDIYKIKGTYAAYPLMLRLFGFEVEIKEYYFDRRLYYLDENINTGTANKSNFKFYLTEKDPTLNDLNIFEKNEIEDLNISTTEIISDTDISQPFTMLNFNKLAEQYTPECVLGYSDVYYENIYSGDKKIKQFHRYDGDVYKYFKTNYVVIKPALYDKNNLNEKQLITIKKFLNLLSPFFWESVIHIETSNTNDKEHVELAWEDIDRKKIVTINSTHGWGKPIFDKENEELPIYPFFIDEDNSILYTPKNKYEDIDNQYNKLINNTLDLFGLEGDTLKNKHILASSSPESDIYYKGISEKDDIDDYILFNHDHYSPTQKMTIEKPTREAINELFKNEDTLAKKIINEIIDENQLNSFIKYKGK